jgi:hypothetical protein
MPVPKIQGGRCRNQTTTRKSARDSVGAASFIPRMAAGSSIAPEDLPRLSTQITQLKPTLSDLASSSVRSPPCSLPCSLPSFLPPLPPLPQLLLPFRPISSTALRSNKQDLLLTTNSLSNLCPKRIDIPHEITVGKRLAVDVDDGDFGRILLCVGERPRKHGKGGKGHGGE